MKDTQYNFIKYVFIIANTDSNIVWIYNLMTKALEELSALESRADVTSKLIKNTIQALGNESKRFQDLQALYQAQLKMGDSILAKLKLNLNSFKDT